MQVGFKRVGCPGHQPKPAAGGEASVRRPPPAPPGQPGSRYRWSVPGFRTVGDATCTGCVESIATDNVAVVEEVAAARITERGATRADDRISEAGMEDRKKEGYF